MDFARLFPEVDLISDDALREKVRSVWLAAMERGGWEEQDLSQIPFTLLIPGIRINLIAHTRAVTRCALKIAESLNESYGDLVINKDYLVAGGLLHDVGKLLEYERRDGGFRTSKNGEMLRHPVSGANIAGECGLPVEVVHIIYTHSKEGDRYERSIESIIIHHSDFLNFEPLKGRHHE
jgi:putative nucleotidyltransferase with HDIG domain